MYRYFVFITLLGVFPPSSLGLPMLSPRASEAGPVAQAIRATWENPSDTMTILLIIGGDIVHMALAQLSGRTFVPVAFSFGWVAYSFHTVMSVVGDGCLMPKHDYPAKLINASTGFARDNRSWVLGRLLRDFERPLGNNVGLSVTIFNASSSASAGVPNIDRYWTSGLITIILQFAVAAIPCGLKGDWSILAVTAAGTLLALATGALPQWRSEKWACRRNSSKVVCLTGGNGTRSVMVIRGNDVGLDLEDLAAAESPRLGWGRPEFVRTIMGLPIPFWFTQAFCLALAMAWIVLLITVTGLKSNTWYLLLVGGLGMIQNVIVAGARRRSGASGIHLEKVEDFERKKAMHALMDVEDAYPKVGRCLLAEFFPNEGGLSPDEVSWWKGDKEAYNEWRAAKHPESLVPRNVSQQATRTEEKPEK